MLKDDLNWFEKEFPKIELFFSELSETVINFAKEYNLLIDKYPNNIPAWNLRFNHPIDGEAYIEISKNIENMIAISGHWFIDDYDKFKRYIKTSAPILIPIKQKELLYKYLTQELGSILAWKKNSWSSISKNYKSDWGRYSKEKFYDMKNKLLFPEIKKQIVDMRGDIFKTIVICDNCEYENNFNQPYPYHAGFGDQGFLYNDEGNLTLIWGSYDKAYSKLFSKIHPWMLTFEQRKKLEDMLFFAPKGGRWRFENVARCLKCGEKIMGSLLNNICYLQYDGSINTEKTDGGFARVLKTNKGETIGGGQSGP